MRIFFPKKGQQKEFMNKILLKISVKEASKICSLSERTIRDWRQEKFLPQYSALKKLSQKTSVPFPSNIKLKDNYWYTILGSSLGGKALIKKYGRIPGDINYRKKKWLNWWETIGKYKKHSHITRPIPIKKPRKSKKLAEFVGIMLGDGNISSSQIRVILHNKDDKEYGEFVKKLIKDLFDVYIGIHNKKNDSSFEIIISRVELVRFCVENLGLKKGNKIKQQVDIPDWIKKNNIYSVACVRGLIDTDGCLFIHRYKIKNKSYAYKKISFTSYSDPLRCSVFDILKNNGFSPRFAIRKDIRLDSVKDVKNYFKIFDSHNPKHLKRYEINV
jgi:hypothetical protein